MTRLRISPSGPFVENDEGGVADPGNGFQLRLDEAGGSTGMAALGTSFVDVTDLAGNPFVVSLDLPDPNKRYKFNFHCEAANVGVADSDLELQLLVSYDGVNYVTLGDNERQVLVGQTTEASIDMPMVLGADIVSTSTGLAQPVPDGAPSISFKVAARSSVAAAIQIPQGGNRGTILLSLAELL